MRNFDKCIMPEMPYCVMCEHGLIIFPEGVENYEDNYYFDCQWICLLDIKEEINNG